MPPLRRILQVYPPPCYVDPPFCCLYPNDPPIKCDWTDPPIPQPLPPAPPKSVPIGLADNRLPVSILVSVALAAAFAFFALATAFLLLLRCRRRRRLHAAAVLASFVSPPDEANGDGGGGEDSGDAGVYHVWYIRTVGLDEAAIASLASTEYRNSGISGGDCAVCLGELRDGELVRLLPQCGHAFHVPCIDTWLRAHVNCPLCRAPVVPASAATAAAATGASSSSSSSASPSAEQGAREAVQTFDEMPVSEPDVEAGATIVDGSCVELQPMGRSLSVNSSSQIAITVVVPPGMADDGTANENEKELVNHTKDGDFTIEVKNESPSGSTSGHGGRIGTMRRSFSLSSQGFLFTKNGRGRSSSVLP